MLAHIAPSVISEQIRILFPESELCPKYRITAAVLRDAAKFALHEIQYGTVILSI